MQPQAKNTIADIVAELDPAVVSSAMVRIERHFKRQREEDRELADALLRVLKSPLGKVLRDRIKEIAADA